MRRIRVLDGWRGIAILLVLVEHLTLNNRQPIYLGSLGVDVFFVLSGYLITSRLLIEREKTGTFSLRVFYLRRAFRILPPVAVYLVVLCVLRFFIVTIDVSASQIVGSLFFFRNYQFAAHPTGGLTEQFWSLAIEEHFYLLWPIGLLRLGNRRSLPFAVALAVASATWRLTLLTHPALRAVMHCVAGGYASMRTDARMDGLLVGCLLALLLHQPGVCRFIFRNFPKETPLLAAFVLYMNLLRTHGYPALSTYLLLALMVGSTLVVQEGLAHNWLSASPLVWIGSISYSVYIWQQLFLLHAANDYPLGRLSVFPINVVCVVLVASASYWLLERPSVEFGSRILHKMGLAGNASKSLKR